MQWSPIVVIYRVDVTAFIYKSTRDVFVARIAARCNGRTVHIRAEQ